MEPDLLNGVAEVGSVALFAALLRWQRFLEVSGRCNPNTRRQYRRLLLSFVADVTCDPDWPGGRDPMHLTEDDVVAYISERTPARGETRNMTLKALRSFYGFAADRELVGRDPCRNLKPGRAKLVPAPSLGKDDLAALFTAAEGVDPRARWAIQLQYATGCRAGSLVALEPGDYRDGVLSFREAKGDLPYSLTLGGKGDEAVTRLLELRDYHPPKARRRPTLLGVGYSRYQQWVQEAGKRAGVDVWTHLIRHTTITRMAENPDVDVRTIMEVANWQDPRLLRRYAAASATRVRAAQDASL